jgi:hypothetical protein
MKAVEARSHGADCEDIRALSALSGNVLTAFGCLCGSQHVVRVSGPGRGGQTVKRPSECGDLDKPH